MRVPSTSINGLLAKYLCLSCVVAGLLLRFCRLNESLWLDEVYSIGVASLHPWPAVFSGWKLFGQADPPLFYFILNGWMRFFGDSERALRLLSALFGSATVLATWIVGTRVLGRAEGMLAAAALAVHPVHIAFSQDIRAYALVTFLGVIAFGLLFEALQRESRGYWAACSAAMIAALYAHNYSLFLVPSLFLWALIYLQATKRVVPWKHLAMCVAAICVGYAPWAPSLWSQINLVRSSNTIPPVVGLREFIYTIYDQAGLLVTMGDVRYLAVPAARAFFWLSLGALILYLAFDNSRNPRWRELVIIPILTLGLPFLISLRVPIFRSNRYPVIVLPFTCLIVSALLARVRAPLVGWLALVVYLALAAPATRTYLTMPRSRDRDIASFIRSVRNPGDWVFVSPSYQKFPLIHYDPELKVSDAAILKSPIAELPENIICVEYGASDSQPQTDWLLRSYSPITTRTMGYADIIVYSRIR